MMALQLGDSGGPCPVTGNHFAFIRGLAEQVLPKLLLRRFLRLAAQ